MTSDAFELQVRRDIAALRDAINGLKRPRPFMLWVEDSGEIGGAVMPEVSETCRPETSPGVPKGGDRQPSDR